MTKFIMSLLIICSIISVIHATNQKADECAKQNKLYFHMKCY